MEAKFVMMLDGDAFSSNQHMTCAPSVLLNKVLKKACLTQHRCRATTRSLVHKRALTTDLRVLGHRQTRIHEAHCTGLYIFLGSVT